MVNFVLFSTILFYLAAVVGLNTQQPHSSLGIVYYSLFHDYA